MIDKLIASPPPNSVVLSFDEKGKTPIKKFSGRRWTNDKQYRIPYAQKVKGLVGILLHGIHIMNEFIIDSMIGRMPIFSSIIWNGY